MIRGYKNTKEDFRLECRVTSQAFAGKNSGNDDNSQDSCLEQRT
jgi:hypothetical protein